MGELTLLLSSARSGDRDAVGQIFALLYPELKAVARARLRRNRRLTMIRDVIIDIVRHEQADKRGGSDSDQTLDTERVEAVADDQSDVLEIAEALEALAAAEPRLATVVEMRYFAGFSDEEIAQALGVTDRTVRRDWDKARAYLMVALRR